MPKLDLEVHVCAYMQHNNLHISMHVCHAHMVKMKTKVSLAFYSPHLKKKKKSYHPKEPNIKHKLIFLLSEKKKKKERKEGLKNLHKHFDCTLIQPFSADIPI